MKKSLAILYIIIFLIILSPIMVTEAQSAVQLMSWFNEERVIQGYDFSAGAVQTIWEELEEGDLSYNPNLSPDFYLGDTWFPVSTPDYHNPLPVINYGNTQLGAITQIPAKNDRRFATQAFVQGNTYGLFTLEGDYVAIRIQSISQPGTAGYEMHFTWQYVKQGQPGGVLNLSLSTSGKTDYALEENIRVEGKLLLDGAPVTDGFVTVGVKDDSGKDLFGVTLPTDSSGGYWFLLEYGWAIPTGYQGSLSVTASATYNEIKTNKSINLTYGSKTSDKELKLQLFGPKDPIEIGGFDSIGIAGQITSQGADVDGALVTMKVAGQTFQTTTGTHTSGSFGWYWNNDTFPAGNYTVEVTVTKDGYQTATGKVPFTVLGEGYDYRVVMDPIPANLEPGERVPFPGSLTLGGKPHYGWIEIEVTFPNGRKNTYSNETDKNGSFTHVQPSMLEEGNYELAAYYHDTGQKISSIYKWTVAKKDTDSPNGESDLEIPLGGQYKIIDVKYLSPTKVGESLEITGRVVLENEQEVIPQEKWPVKIIIKGQDRFNTERKAEYDTATKPDGSFSVKGSFGLLLDTIAIVAQDQYTDWTNQVNWFGPLKCIVDLNPLISLDQTDYDQGSIIRGTLDLQPASRPDGWFAGLDIIYQAIGPIGGAENLYLFATERPDLYSYGEYRGFEHFSWEIPDDAESGSYELTAYITGSHISAATVKETFYINDIKGTLLNAYVEHTTDGWSPAQLIGYYSDHTGARIPDADLRLYFRGGAESEEPREFEMTGSVGPDGSFALDLEPFELFAARGRENPWEKQYWEVTAYADKEKYATAATILRLITPTVRPNLEIVSIDPPLNFLNEKAARGLNYEQLTDMDITLRVRYNNIFESGANITVGSRGFWNVLEEGGGTEGPLIIKLQLKINGQSRPPWDSRKSDDKWYELSAIYDGNIYLGQPYHVFYYPRFEINVPAQTGLRQEAEFILSGKLFGNMHFDPENPSIPSPWARGSIVEVWAELGNGEVSAVYKMDPPKMNVEKSTAWVAVNDGRAEFTISNGHVGSNTTTTGYKLANENVKLEIVSKEIVDGRETNDYTPTTDIEINTSAVSDEDGRIELPLKANIDPCLLQKEAKVYYIKVTSDKFSNEELIPILLRCVKKLEFDLTDVSIIPVQTVDLSQGKDYALVAGKEAGVRVNLGVEGEIYQPLHRPVNFKVLFELLQDGVEKPLVVQEKIVSLHEDGAKARWADPAQQVNNGGIGEIELWNHAISGQKPASLEGKETVPIDFIFTPQTPFSKEAKYKIRITVDPDEVYGKQKQAEIKGKVHKMKTLRLIVVPVDIDNLDMRFVFDQLDFIYQTYPIGRSNLIIELRDPYYTKNIPWSCTSLTHLKEIACGLSKTIGTGGDANNETRILGIVSNVTWLNERDFILYWAGAVGAVGSYSPSFLDSPINNVTLVRYPENVAYTTAHEVGHTYGLELKEQYKTNPPNGLPVHGLVLKTGQIFNIPPDYKATKSQGPRANWQKYGFRGAAAIFDLMGNAGYYLHSNGEELVFENSQKSWIVYKTWKALFEKLKDPVSQPLYAIRGTIDPENGLTLEPLTIVEGIPDLDLYNTGVYELQLQSSAGEILSSARFGDTDMPGPININLPYQGGLGRIVVLKNNALVGEVLRSANNPELILLNEPFINEELMNLTIEWLGSDPDNEPLSYFLHYRKSESEPWYPIAANLSETIYSINLSQLPGGLCSFRVTASDGINLAYAYTEPIQLPPRSPSAAILNDEVEEVEEGEPVLLRGLAFDSYHGIITDENLFWSSDIDGDLGSGSALLTPLSSGPHEISLTAYDQEGNITVVTSKLWIGEILTGMGSGLQSLWLIGAILLLLLITLVVMFILILKMRKRKKQLSL
jgi:hypothetical protein